MERIKLVTITGDYWHFHPMGTGLTYTYHKKAKQLIVCNVATGVIIDTLDLIPCGFDKIEQFKAFVMEIYSNMALEKGYSIEEKYFDDKIKSGDISIGIDFDLLKN